MMIVGRGREDTIAAVVLTVVPNKESNGLELAHFWAFGASRRLNDNRAVQPRVDRNKWHLECWVRVAQRNGRNHRPNAVP
ncbi:hypothetical protein VTI74DRAFT_10285 [Chaetomium olivicolor]